MANDTNNRLSRPLKNNGKPALIRCIQHPSCWLLLLLLCPAISDGASSTGRLNPSLFSRLSQSTEPILKRFGRASQQLGVHVACAPTSFGIAPRIICLSGAASYTALRRAYQRSDAAQRACFFWKRAGPIVAHYKFTQWWLKASKAPLEKRHVVYKSLHDRYCQPSLDIILNLKGLYVKMGQVMSSRSDFMPIQYVEVFATVQDSIPQWPIEEALAIVKKSLMTERGLEYEDVFEEIDPVAVGSASIGQVHRATLKDEWAKSDPTYKGGKTVALKIMHPDAKQKFACDFQVFKWLLRLAMPGWRPLLEELERRLMTEFDYHNEANSLARIRDNMRKSPYKRKVRIPQPYRNLCCKQLLVMEMLNGKKMTDAIEDKLSRLLGGDTGRAHDLLAQRQREVLFGENGATQKEANLIELFNLHGIGGMFRALKGLSLYRQVNRYVDLLVDVHGHQIFHDGCFNGDPHAGNVMQLKCGRLGLIDYGQVRTLSDHERLSIGRIVANLGEGADSRKIAESMRLAGFRSRLDDDRNLAEYAALFFDSDHKSKKLGYATPQHYFQELMESDALLDIPDAAIMVARVSLLFRGAGSALNRQVQTSVNWQKHAKQALIEAGYSPDVHTPTE